MESTASTQTKPPSKSFGRKLVSVFFLLIALVAVAYFVVTSSAFIKGVVLPRAGTALNATISADEVSLSPFRHLSLKNLKIEPKDAEPVLTAKEIRLKYSVTQILGGTLDVSEATLISPVIRIVQNADGTSNLDPILESLQSEKEEPETTSKTPQLNIRNVSIQDAQFVLVQGQPGGGKPAETEISGFNLKIDQIKNGSDGKLAIDANLRLSQSEADIITAKLKGQFDWALSDNLLPRSVQGNTAVEVLTATGTFDALKDLKTSLISDLTPEEIKGLSLKFERGNTELGSARITGPYNPDTMEADLTVNVANIDRQVLNLVGAASGLDFGKTVLNANSRIQVTKEGTQIAVSGKVEGRSVEVRTAGQDAPPPVDIDAAYTLSLDLTAQSAEIKVLDVQGKQNERTFLTATLSNPMQVSWGGAAAEMPASDFALTIDKLNLSDWHAILGDALPAGQLSAQLKIQTEQSGQLIKMDLSSQLENLKLALGEQAVDQVSVRADLKGQLKDMAAMRIDQIDIAVNQAGQKVLTSTGSARYDAAKSDIAFKMNTGVEIPAALKLLAMPDAQATSGTMTSAIDFNTATTGQTNIVSTVNLANFSGRYGDYKFSDYQAAVDSQLVLKSGTLEIQKFIAKLNNEGEIKLTGSAGLETGTVALKIQSSNLNERVLRPFLESAMGEGRLVSVALNIDGDVARDAQGVATVKSAVAIKNLKVRDDAGKTPDQPLSAELAIDGTFRPDLADLREIRVSLAPTQRASNKLTLSGKIPLNDQAANPGSLTIKSDGLDLTPYYDLFVAKAPPGSSPAPAPAQKTEPEIAGSGGPESEPGPVNLPFKQFVLDLDVKKLFLGEILIENWVTKATINDNRVRLDPFKMTLNNAPVESTADIDLSVAGYRYDLMVKAAAIPIAPIANTFSPSYKNQAEGDLIVDTSLRGQGITGVNLQKHLNGHARFAFTNANIQVISPRLRFVMTPIALLLRIQDLLKSPINSLSADLAATNGTVQIQPFYLRSEAFEANVKGPVRIANRLMQTPLNLPIDIALRRSVAQKSNLIPANTPPEATYVSLPSFAQLNGTLEAPEAKTDKLVIAGLIAQSAGGIPKLIGKEAAGQLQGIGNFLTGQKTGTDTETSTNKTDQVEGATPPEKPVVPNPLDLINRFRRK